MASYRSAFSALKCQTAQHKPYDFSQLLLPEDAPSTQRRLTLFVNVASRCGYTPQYAGLEALNKEFKDKGLTILGFPCNQFLFQEPGSSEEAAQSCQLNYGVSFQIMEKINVNTTFFGLGSKEHPVYEFLKSQKPGSIEWNFAKFGVDGNGNVIKRWAPKETPESMKEGIRAYLNGEKETIA